MKSKIIVLIVLCQIVLIIFISYKIYQKRVNVLVVTNISPVRKENIVQNPHSKLKYFYEPGLTQANQDNPTWITKKPKYTFNTDSLNERFDYKTEKPDGVYRIIMLGASFPYGIYMDTSANYTEQLEDKLNTDLHCKNISHFDVINLGVPGYDIQYEVERYRIRGQKYNPDLVLWAINDSDINRINEITIKKETDITKKMGIVRYSKEYYLKDGVTFPSWRLALKETSKELGYNNLIKMQFAFLQSINDYFKHGLIVYNPLSLQNDHQQLIKRFVNERSLTRYFDESIDKRPDFTSILFPDNHPNEKGHKIIAQDLFRYLKDNNIIPCD